MYIWFLGCFFLKWNLYYLIIKFYVFKFKGVFGSKIYLVVYILFDVVGFSVFVDVVDVEDNEYKDGVYYELFEYGLSCYFVLL